MGPISGLDVFEENVLPLQGKQRPFSVMHSLILRRFERKIIRRIYGPVRQGREWRIRNNEEVDNTRWFKYDRD